jgi:hypothetical protein
MVSQSIAHRSLLCPILVVNSFETKLYDCFAITWALRRSLGTSRAWIHFCPFLADSVRCGIGPAAVTNRIGVCLRVRLALKNILDESFGTDLLEKCNNTPPSDPLAFLSEAVEIQTEICIAFGRYSLCCLAKDLIAQVLILDS